MNIVFLHGLAGSKRLFANLEKKFADTADTRTFSFDLLGFGENWHGKTGDYTVTDHLTFISDKITERFGSEPVAIIGHSMGALLALLWTIQNPQRVTHVVLLNMPFGLNKQELERSIRDQKSGWSYLILAHRLSAFISCTVLCKGGLMTIFQFLKPSYVPREVFHDYMEHSWKSLSKSFRNIILENPGQELIQLIQEIPILNLVGAEDSELSRREIRQDNVTNKAIKGGHFMILENPQQTSDEIKKFLKPEQVRIDN